MTLARLAVVVLFVGLISATGQQQLTQANTPQEHDLNAANVLAIPAAQPRSGSDAQDLLRDLGSGQRRIKLGERGSALLADGSDASRLFLTPLQGDDVELPVVEICYNIRGYVVARDSKDSDATHPVKSSTCQRASRFRVKAVAPTMVVPADVEQAEK